MITEAINIIEIYAVRGQGQALESPIAALAKELQSAMDCISYHATRSPANADLWIVSGQWASEVAMEEHYKHPALNGVMRLLGCHAVNRISVSSFFKTAA
jgi:quinol monooxygenase YgiN